MKPSKVLILYTGGTFGMKNAKTNDATSPLVPQKWDEVWSKIDAIQPNGFFEMSGISLDYQCFETPIDSTDMEVSHWQQIAKIIYSNYNTYIGFVIIHGTDTMAYTASVLSFMFHNLTKPIILTGAQLPISNPRTDAITNLTDSVYLAAASHFNLPIIPEVVICFDNNVFRGNRTVKSSSQAMKGFKSPNFPLLGQFGENIKIWDEFVLKPKDQICELKSELIDDIALVQLFPGYNIKYFKKMLNDDEIKVIIIKSFGSGNIPNDPLFHNMIQYAIEQKKHIINITQCLSGSVKMGKYQTSQFLQDIGVICGKDITTEAAIAKSMCLLAHSNQFKTDFESNLRGEIS